MSSSTPTPNNVESPSQSELTMTFRSRLTETRFEDWHRIQERERNEAEGYGDTRNDLSHMPEPDEHSPSSLLSCHRMVYYKAHNTPREDRLPYGIFKFGHDFEAYVEQFLADEVAGDHQTVNNVERIEFDVNGVTFTGSTDPVIFDERTGEPAALFEVKTTGNLYFTRRDGEAKERHRAQAHAYAKGLQHKYDMDEPPQIFYIYGGREDLDVAMFDESFDAEFWEDTVIDWAEENTEHRKLDVLPPTVDDSKSYMCGYCDYAERCGNYEPTSKSPNSDDYVEEMDEYWWDDTIATSFQNTVSDMPPVGFLPLKKYPEDAVVAHLATYPDVKLTPTLAVQYPYLVADGNEPLKRLERVYGVAPKREVGNWVCPKCMQSFSFEQFDDWDGDFDNLPTCPDCPDDPPLRGPKPGEIVL